MKTGFVLLAALAFAGAASAQMYKWVDKDGRVRYGDTPPPGAKALPLKAPSGTLAPSAPAAKKDDAARKDAGAKTRTVSAGKAARDAGESRASRQNCDAAKANLRYSQSGRARMTTNPAGEPVVMSDEQLKEQTQKALKLVNDLCR